MTKLDDVLESIECLVLRINELSKKDKAIAVSHINKKLIPKQKQELK